ncbi:MAG: BlaI/MecI/CopY family transcriptional regulator [Lysobacterales bacterium]
MNAETRLSELQLDVMQVLWRLGNATSGEVCAALADQRQLALTTVATLLKRLEDRGLVSHTEQGRKFVYRAQVEEKDVQRDLVGGLIKQMFLGDPAALVNHLLGDQPLTEADRQRIMALIEKGADGEAQ